MAEGRSIFSLEVGWKALVEEVKPAELANDFS